LQHLLDYYRAQTRWAEEEGNKLSSLYF
jgi:hypothetical protein